MPTVQNLKRKLRSVLSTVKISKAMKTVSTVKYSRISALYSGYEKYEKQNSILYESIKMDFNRQFSAVDPGAPVCIIVMASNKGMCGDFNSEVFRFTRDYLSTADFPYTVFICGKQAESFFTEKGIGFEKSFIFDDIPKYEDAVQLIDCVYSYLKHGKISAVKLIYPMYYNMMKQVPVCCDLLSFEEDVTNKQDCLFIPDKQSVIENSVKKILASLIYKKVLETGLGAQAATLMTMRSAYDTATDYCAKLESEISRKRQEQVTADVIETSSEHWQKEEE